MRYLAALLPVIAASASPQGYDSGARERFLAGVGGSVPSRGFARNERLHLVLGRRLTILVVLAGAAALVAAPATASKADDQQIADDAVLSAAEVPPGFTAVQAAQGDAELPPECPMLERAQRAVEQVPHASSAFALDEAEGDGYALLQSTAAVFAKAGRAESVYDLYRGAKAKRCIAALLEATFAQPGVTVDVQIGTFHPELDDKGSKKVIQGGDAFVGYAGGVRADAGGEPHFYEFAAVVTRAGRGIGRVLVVNSGAVPSDDLQRFTQKIVETLDQAR